MRPGTYVGPFGLGEDELYEGCAGPLAPVRCLLATDTLPTTASQRIPPKMRVLVAFEDVRSSYSRVIARAIRELRPGLEVRSIVVEELERELGRFDPHELSPRTERDKLDAFDEDEQDRPGPTGAAREGDPRSHEPGTL